MLHCSIGWLQSLSNIFGSPLMPHRIRYAKYMFIFVVVLYFFSNTKTTRPYCILTNILQSLKMGPQIGVEFAENIYCVWVWYRFRPHICEKVPDRLIIAMDCSSKWKSSGRGDQSFFLTSRRIAKCLIYEPLKEKSIFSTFHWLSARKKTILRVKQDYHQ